MRRGLFSLTWSPRMLLYGVGTSNLNGPLLVRFGAVYRVLDDVGWVRAEFADN